MKVKTNSNEGRNDTLSVALGAEARNALDALAAKRQEESGRSVYAADIVRDAVVKYLAGEGITVKIPVRRGGDRRTAAPAKKG